MTTDQQKLALLEWAGWRFKQVGAASSFRRWRIVRPDSSQVFEHFETREEGIEFYCPKLSSLDVIAEFEGKLRGTDEQYFNDVFYHRRWKYEYYLLRHGGVSATASQRLEALVRTLGLWREGV